MKRDLIVRFLTARDFSFDEHKLRDKNELCKAIEFVLNSIEEKRQASTLNALDTRLSRSIETHATLLAQKQDKQKKIEIYNLIQSIRDRME